jgi:small subunit ribosomal protein S17
MPKRQLIGKVISNKMQKTVVVEVERLKEHPIYKRRYRVHKKYKAHDEKGEYHVGDRVIIEECRPLSKEKRWRVIARISNE